MAAYPDASWDYVPEHLASGKGMIDAERMGSWESVAAEYPKSGPPGISYFRGVRPDRFQVNCLLYRDEAGELIGVLAHYPATIPELERRGQGNIWVHPDHRRKGIARQLVHEFVRRGWPAEYQDLRTTPDGAALFKQINQELRPYRDGQV